MKYATGVMNILKESAKGEGMTREELEMRTLVRESDVIDRTDGSELAKAFNYLWEKYVEQESRTVIEDIKAEIKDLHKSHMINFVSADGAVDTCLEIIDKHISGKEKE